MRRTQLRATRRAMLRRAMNLSFIIAMAWISITLAAAQQISPPAAARPSAGPAARVQLSPEQKAKLAGAQADYDDGKNAIDAGNYSLAETQLRRSYQTRLDILTSEHPDTLLALNYFAEAILREG